MPSDKPLDYRSQADCEELAHSLMFLTEQPVTVDLAAKIYDAGLMRINFFIRMALTLHRLRFGTTFYAWQYMEAKAPGTCNDFVLGTARWCAKGKDLTDPQSAGGFCEEEFNELVKIVDSFY